MTTASHAATVQCLPAINLGFSFLYLLASEAIAAVVGFGLAWYIRGRGMAGVKIDIDNVKTDVENLKAKVSGSAINPTV